MTESLIDTLAQLREISKARQSLLGCVFSNTHPANPTELDTESLGILLGFIEPKSKSDDVIVKQPHRATNYVTLTKSCEVSSTVERFNDVNKPELGGVLHPSTAVYPEFTAPNNCLLYGVDTLYLMATLQICPTILEALQTYKDQGNVTIASGPFRWKMQKYGAAPHWTFVLKSPACTVKIRNRSTYDQNVYIELRSALLWSMGAKTAANLLYEVLQRWALQAEGKLKGTKHNDTFVSVSADSVKLHVSRIDLAADFDGLLFDGTELTNNRFITRARKRTVYTAASSNELQPTAVSKVQVENAIKLLQDKAQHKDAARMRRNVMAALGAQPMEMGELTAEHGRASMHVQGVTLTGYSFGAGAILCRMYRKDIEIKHGKQWFRALWNGYKGPVWRVEFQLRADGLNTFKFQGRFTRELDSVLSGLDGLWAHLTARDAKGWISLRDIGNDKKRERWQVSEVWRRVQSVRWSDSTSVHRDVRGKIAPANRIKTPQQQIQSWCAGSMINRETGLRYAELLAPQLAGLAASMAAALQLSEQRADPQSELDAQERINKALAYALKNTKSNQDYASTIGEKADNLAMRAAWLQRAQSKL